MAKPGEADMDPAARGHRDEDPAQEEAPHGAHHEAEGDPQALQLLARRHLRPEQPREPARANVERRDDEQGDNEKDEGAHAREDFSDRNDTEWMKHTLAWLELDTGKVKIDYRPVHSYTMSDDIAYILPKQRVY